MGAILGARENDFSSTRQNLQSSRKYRMKIAIIGTGYVGLVTGTCLAEVGHDVTCVDLDARKVKLLKDGISPIFEAGLEGLIKSNLAHERIQFTTDIKQALIGVRAVFLAVGTPQGEDGSADLQHILKATESVALNLTGDATVIVKSTVPVGTCSRVNNLIRETLAKRNASLRVSVASNPEFLQEGVAVDNFLKPDRIVVGIDHAADRQMFEDMYAPFILDNPGKLMVMDCRSSELTKYAANAMLATRISFMNEMARLCEKVGANVDNLRLGMGADPRIGRKFLFAGPGYGGSCFPKDVSALVKTGQDFDVNLTVLDAVKAANVSQMAYSFKKIKNQVKDLKGKTIAVWGLAFKPGTDDVREAPAKFIINEFLKEGAKVVAHDPEAMETFKVEIGDRDGLSYAKDAYGATSQADALVVVTEWREYRRPNWNKIAANMKSHLVFDLRNQYDSRELKEAKFGYYCIGRPDDGYSKA